jgi:hypothetical protein
MTKRTGIVGAIVLTVILSTFAGSALAGNGNGNGAGQGNGNGNSQATPATETASPTHGNSASAPGQNKDSTSSTSSTPSTSGSGKSGGGHQATKPSGSSSTTKGSASQNSGSQSGMKPTNATTHHTYCSTGGSASSTSCTPMSGNTAGVQSGKSDVSKRYGNGNTAAQIAVSRGAPANTMIYGPGNSQPHKVQPCPGSNHWVDVHAVKSYSTASCAASTPSSESATTQHVCGATTVTTTKTVTQKGHAYGLLKQGKALHTRTKTETTTTPTGEVCSSSSTTTFLNVVTQQASKVGSAVAGQTPAATQTAGGSQLASSPSSGVLGVTATAKSGKPAGGVAGALAAVGNVAGQTLPFTGFPLWIAVLVAAGLIALGFALRRQGRATV